MYDEHWQDASDEVLRRTNTDNNQKCYKFVVAFVSMRLEPASCEAVPVRFYWPTSKQQHKDKRDAICGDK